MHKIQKCGLPPGTLIHVGRQRMEQAKISVIDYDEEEYSEFVVQDVEELRKYTKSKSVTWVNVDGLHEVEIIERIGEMFGIHALVLEDILHTEHRPKADFYEDYAFIVLKMLNYNASRDSFDSEQLSLILGRTFVITFQEEPGDVFDTVRERIRKASRTRQRGADFLAYSLMDLVIDTYFYSLERMGEWIENLELEIIRKPNRRRTLEINELKRDLNFLRKNIWPVREVVHAMQRQEDDNLIGKDIDVYLNDLYDHSISVIDTVETYREMIGNLMDLYLSNISYKMNEVMKTLTVITSIFIPLTFITGIYGMNFENMPELKTEYGYFVVLGIILFIGGFMVVYFKRKGWFN